jgi:hypothetical protein
MKINIEQNLELIDLKPVSGGYVLILITNLLNFDLLQGKENQNALDHLRYTYRLMVIGHRHLYYYWWIHQFIIGDRGDHCLD